jgi:hypothetical protein
MLGSVETPPAPAATAAGAQASSSSSSSSQVPQAGAAASSSSSASSSSGASDAAGAGLLRVEVCCEHDPSIVRVLSAEPQVRLAGWGGWWGGLLGPCWLFARLAARLALLSWVPQQHFSSAVLPS